MMERSAYLQQQIDSREETLKAANQEITMLRGRIAELEDRGTAQSEPTYSCVVCHRSRDEVEFGLLTDITVVVADGEEGYSNVTLLLCDDDLNGLAETLRKLGFIDHRHGSTSTLEDIDCPGYYDMARCPIPTHYGNVTWGRVPPQDEEE